MDVPPCTCLTLYKYAAMENHMNLVNVVNELNFIAEIELWTITFTFTAYAILVLCNFKCNLYKTLVGENISVERFVIVDHHSIHDVSVCCTSSFSFGFFFLFEILTPSFISSSLLLLMMEMQSFRFSIDLTVDYISNKLIYCQHG